MKDSIVEKSTLLLADPFMYDPYFKRAAILICEHHPEGSLGFIINRKLGLSISELLVDFPKLDFSVYYGGPVSTDTVHYIHKAGDLIKGSVELANGVYWGGDYEQLKFMIQSCLIDPEDVRFFVGYSGWDEGQLNTEITLGSWITAKLDKDYLFEVHTENIWKSAMYDKGNYFKVIGDIPDENIWN
jgi:putative transcriptional regulator